MRDFELRTTLNLLSAVLAYRPPPLRQFDQIYMRGGDLLLHADHVSHFFDGKSVAFVGDGDAVAMMLAILCKEGQIACKPKLLHVFDFDERIVHSVRRFAQDFQLTVLDASPYNVVDPFPEQFEGTFDAFHTNPPYGASNNGKSIEAFVQRGIESCCGDCTGIVVQADDPTLPWTTPVLHAIQAFLVRRGFALIDIRSRAHQYHLDDSPDLTSCTMAARRAVPDAPTKPRSTSLPDEFRANFYGADQSITIARVRDLTHGGRRASRDVELVRLEGGFAENDE